MFFLLMIKRKVVITLIVLIALVAVFYFASDNITKYTGLLISGDIFDNKEASFECLDGKDVTLYINSEDISDSLEKLELGDYLLHVEVFNCLRDNQECLENGVDSFPSLVVDGVKVNGEISVDSLLRGSGC